MQELTLLIGNGINRLGNKQGPSWGQLLNSIQKSIGKEIDLNNDFKPFPMAFEEMLLTNCNNYEARLKSFKKGISEAFLAAKPNDFHRQIVNSKYVKNIFTTNYDYGFERVLISDFSNLKKNETTHITKEIKYSLRRKNEIESKSIWHIHGEIYDPKTFNKEKKRFKEESILIGYEHYSESLKVLQDYKNGRNNWAQTPLKTKLNDNAGLGSAWIDYFFTSELLIFGLDLGFSEIDLWWVLNYRARLFSEYRTKSARPNSFRNSKIRYFYPKITKKSIAEMEISDNEKEKIKRDLDKMKARADLLRAFAVEIEEIPCKDYENFFQKIINNNLN